MNPKVNFYFTKAKRWQEELEALRTIILEEGLTETLKWGVPCYMHQERNIVLIHVFKDYCAMLFFKGALLKDRKGILIQQTKNVQMARQIRFTSVDEVVEKQSVLKDYIQEAINVEKDDMISGSIKKPVKKTPELDIPEEFKNVLKANPDLKVAFEALTPGRQRAYMLYFSAAKQSKTREARIEKWIPQILKGKGLNEE